MNDAVHPQQEPLQEFEREPVPENKRKGLFSFLGIYAGEHVAGTEFMIGPLFLAAGVSAFDLLAGLLVGNILAVLSWTFICAPIAARLRVTLYYKLEKICGVRLVTLYNLANGVLFCFLAGAMITVSATAVGVPFAMKMPGLSDWLPTSVLWVVTVVLVGAVFSLVAARGYDAMVKVANLAVPWMALIFLACGIVALPQLGVHSLSELWSVASEKIWTGGAPLKGPKFTFWHVMFFAWFCNAAVHMGMADMSILRYAKKWQYGASSAAGMFFGQFIAWICASLLYALQLKNANWTPGMEPPPVLPGPMAYDAVGLAGLVCVMVAGWTTANPTIYRAGLAFQAILPKSSRFKVTLVAGGIATLGALFPALVMMLLEFVALYGTILMPMGAVIVVDYYLLTKFGLQPDYAEQAGIKVNWAAGLAWVLALGFCLALNQLMGVQVYFLALPGWVIAGAVYLLCSRFYQKTLSKRPDLEPSLAR
jgi:purine-cytosine permease-like protein